MSILNVEHLTHGFGDRAIFQDVSFRLLKGEHIGLIGANGEGKSTFMNIITGKLMPDEGKIEWAKNVRVGYLDQHTVLQKGMTIRQVLSSAFNFLFEMETRMNEICDKMGEASETELEEYMEELGTIQELLTQHDFYMIDSKIEEVARALGLLDVGLDADVTDLSGGQRTKVLLAKLLLEKPEILLLDEPLGALDLKMRKEMQLELKEMHERLGITFIYVTHDQEEATEVADRVVVMSQGNIEQADAPDQVWREPATRFVLEFMGEVNRLQGTIRGGQFHVGAHRWPLGYTPAYQGPVDLFLRPWEVDISRRTSLDSPLPVQVLEASPKGHYTQLVVQPLGWYNEPLTVVMHGDDAPQRGERLFVGLQHARLYNGDERIETRDEELALAQSA